MATVNVDTSQNLTAVTYVAGDTINIRFGAVLTIDSTPAATIGSITCTTTGTCIISNASTSTPLVITLTNASSRLTFTGRGILQIRGAAITVYTGTGGASQTVADFSSLYSSAIEYPSYMDVETGSGTGIYRPWYIIPTVGSGYTATYTSAAFGNGDLGNVLFWNGTTKVVTCGDGTNGKVIPNGAKVRIPNIHIKAAVGSSTITSRAQTSSDAGGQFDMQWVGFSNTFYHNYTNAASIIMDRVGIIGRVLGSSHIYASIQNSILNPDPLQTTTEGFALTGILITQPTTQPFKSVYAMTAAANTPFSLTNAYNVDIDTIESVVIARSTNLVATALFAVYSSVSIKNLTVIGGRFLFTHLNSCELVGIRFSDTATGSTIATNSLDLFTFSGVCDLVVIRDIALTSPGAAFRGQLHTDANTVNRVIIHNAGATIDGQSNANLLWNPSGSKSVIANLTLNNIRSSLVVGGSTGVDNTTRGVGNNNATTGTIAGHGTWFDGLQAANLNTAVQNRRDVMPFSQLFNSPKTTGTLIAGQWSPELSADTYEVTGTAYVDSTGLLQIPGNGDTATLKAIHPIRSITSFQNSAATITSASGTGLAYEFRVAIWTVKGDRTWSSWLTINGSNLSSALSGLTGYSSSVGFDMQMRITASTAVANRTVTKVAMLTNNDSAWLPSPATVPVTINNAINGSVVGVFDNASALIGVGTVGSSGTVSVDKEFAFDGTSTAYTARIRKLGYFSKDIAGSHTFLNVNIPAAQLTSFVDVSAGASVTGVAVNHTTGKVTVTTSHTIAQVYAYVQYDLASIANIDKPDYLETTDGVNYTMTYDLTVDGCALTGTANVSMATKTFSLINSATTTLVVTDINGTNGFIVLTGLSAHAVFVKDNSGTQKLYSASVTGSTTVYIPTGSTGSWTYVIKKAGYKHQIGTIAAATGGTFTITASTPIKLNADGTDMYLGTTSALVQVTFTGTTQANIDIGDGIAGLQATFDETEDALVTNNGMIWLGAGKDDTSQFNSGGGDFLFLSAGWRLRRWHSGDDNATIQAFVQSVDGTPVDGTNGPVAFLSTDTPATIAAAVGALVVGGTLSFEESIRLINSMLYALVSGADTGNFVFKAVTNSSKTRLTGTGDEFGNRSSMTIVDTSL